MTHVHFTNEEIKKPITVKGKTKIHFGKCVFHNVNGYAHAREYVLKIDNSGNILRELNLGTEKGLHQNPENGIISLLYIDDLYIPSGCETLSFSIWSPPTNEVDITVAISVL